MTLTHVAAGGREEWRRYWPLPLVAALGMAASVLFLYSIGPFIAPLHREFGWSRAQITSGILIANGLAAVFTTFVGIAVDRYGPRRIGLLGVCIMCGTVALLGTATGGWWDRIAMRVIDALLAFPVLVLAIAVAVAFGRGATGIVFAVAFANVPIFARLARAQGMRLCGLPFMAATEIMGCSFGRRLFRHLLPNMINSLVVQASVSLSFAVLIEAGLSFLGLGVQPPRPALGLMIAEAKAYIGMAPFLVLFPAMAIVLTVVGFNLLGDALAEATDPRRSAI